MSRNSRTWFPSVLVLLGAACAEPRAVSGPEFDASESRASSPGAKAAQGVFHRFVSIGTSVSMGWQSDGAIAASQLESWTAQLARLAGREQTLPLLSLPGCRSPLKAPLSSGVRLSGEAAGAPAATLNCAPLEEGLTVPAQNVSISAAKTFDALNTTPETQFDGFYRKLYPRILPPHTTQLQAAIQQKPKFISVELGANDVIDARSGIAIVGATITPFPLWASHYSTLVDEVAMNVRQGILVSLLNDAATFPSFRRGAEIAADRATMFAAFNVNVLPDCNASPNLLFVPVRIPTIIAAGLTARAQQQPAVPFSCAGGAPTSQDFVLTPSEVAIVNAQLAQMNAFIEAQADRHGFAVVPLEVLYGRADLKPPFSSVQLMTSMQPYGPLMSLDGIHPNGAGHAIIAAAAASAISAHYGMRFPSAPGLIAGQ